MNHKAGSRKHKASGNSQGFTKISVCGYKSIAHRQSIDIRPLTILAGANSSGKSSIVQPILLMKQTLEASYDPGPLLLDGPNVRFTSGDQFLSRASKGKSLDVLSIAIGSDHQFRVDYKWDHVAGLEIKEMTTYLPLWGESTFRPGMSHAEVVEQNPRLKGVAEALSKAAGDRCEWVVTRDRCFLRGEIAWTDTTGERHVLTTAVIPSSPPAADAIRELIHVPGLRGNPERTYPVTAVGSTFPGTFEKYVASVIAQWQVNKDEGRLEALNRALGSLGLTWKVAAAPITHTQVELQVGRLPHAKRGGAHDLVSIADVGFGVSQTLPVIVALLVAKPGQAVYLEQPEIHLHPRAQARMAELLSEAAQKGVRVIVETHSSLLLRAVQTLVAKGAISPDLVKLHWFTRLEDGSTEVKSADLDEHGAFGDWPEDFDETAITTEREYLDAAEARSQVQ